MEHKSRNIPVMGWSAEMTHTAGLSFLLIVPWVKSSSTTSLPCKACNNNIFITDHARVYALKYCSALLSGGGGVGLQV